MKKEQIQLHESVAALYKKQFKTLQQILRALFSVAGCLWILKYAFPFSNQETLFHFTAQQYQLYLLLLTVWGYNYKREVSRMQVLMRLSDTLDIPTHEVQSSAIGDAHELHRFDVLTKVTNDGKWFAVLFTWTLLLLSIAQIVRQLMLLL